MKKHLGVLCLFTAALAAFLSTTRPAFAQATNTFPASGNAGIGTLSPSSPLHISTTGSALSTMQTSGGSGNNAGVEFIGGSGSHADWQLFTNRGDVTANAYDLGFYQHGASSSPLKMVLQGETGNLGIGTTGPTAALDVQTGVTAAAAQGIGVRFQQTLTAAANNDFLTALYVNPTFTDGAFTGVTHYGLLVPTGLVGIGTTSPKWPFQTHVGTDQNWAIISSSSHPQFGAINDAANGYVTGSIDASTLILNTISGGRVGILTSSPSYTLQVNGSVAGTSAYVNTSDGRLKTDITPLAYGLAAVMKLHPVGFNWKNQDQEWKKQHQIGLIAQEVETVVPEVVTVADDEMRTMSIAYGSLVPVLIQAIQELKAKNDSQGKAIDELRHEYDAYKKTNTVAFSGRGH